VHAHRGDAGRVGRVGDEVADAGNFVGDGGAGEDCAEYADTAIGVFVSLIDAVARNNEGDITAWTDKLISIENVCGGEGNDQLLGDRVSYGHIRAERIVGRMPTGLTGDLRVGIAFELGKVADPVSEPRRTGLLNSTVIYMRGETPFGPAYIGLGQSSSGPVNAYLFIGTP
jgi:hypothetical protein